MVGLEAKFRSWKHDNTTHISEIAAQMTAQNEQIKRLEKAVRDLAKAVRPQGTALGPIRNILKQWWITMTIWDGWSTVRGGVQIADAKEASLLVLIVMVISFNNARY